MNRRLALVIGNTEYQDQRLARLVSPQADVRALADVLRAADIGGFAEVRTLLNESASQRLPASWAEIGTGTTSSSSISLAMA